VALRAVRRRGCGRRPAPPPRAGGGGGAPPPPPARAPPPPPPGLGDLVNGSATGLCAAIITAVDLD
ncbi:hypothetical protein OFL47_00670, partial [Pseudomonas aeruginosa]|uniref:hypothetical protein n=1 Tax=Pseudomonas aeruginosa TaxID=287 RepID=UPI0021F1747A